MKTIQFTDEEIQSLEGFTAISSAASKIKLAKKMPNGSTLSDDALLFYVTPSEAVEEVCDRRKAAREENEKRIAKQMIEELENAVSDGFNKFIDLSCKMSSLEKDRDKYKKMYEDNRIV